MIIRILAGANIKEMQEKTMSQVINSDFPGQLSVVSRIKKPIIAAVNGFAVCLSFLFKFVFLFLFIS
jgi:enoyl-CoA hydratase/carnithine racemase